MKTFEYAGFWERAGALMIDVVIMSVPSAVVGYIFSSAFVNHMTLRGVAETTSTLGGKLIAKFAGIAAAWVYYATMESSLYQATLGKRILGIQVADSDLHRLSFGRATGRFFGRILSSIPFCLGFLVQPFTSRRQTWHDMLASSVVVRRARKSSPTDHSCSSASLHGTQPLEQSTVTVDDNTLVSEDEEIAYAQAKKELEIGNIREGLWAKVTAEETTDERCRLRYVQYRARQLWHANKKTESETRRQIRATRRQNRTTSVLHWTGFVALRIGIWFGITSALSMSSFGLIYLLKPQNDSLSVWLILLPGLLVIYGFPIYLIVAIVREAKRRKASRFAAVHEEKALP